MRAVFGIISFISFLRGILCLSAVFSNETQRMCDFAVGISISHIHIRGWNCSSSNNPLFSICKNSSSIWDGVYCHSSSIIGINLNSFGMTGTISKSIGYISGLKYLYLNSNSFHGSLPSSIGFLKNLMKLSLSNNFITGKIPPTIGFLENLEELNMATNSITGTIPASIGSLAKLYQLKLQSNLLTGDIPLEIGSLTALNYVALFLNKLSGSIPTTIGYLKQLSFLDFIYNSLTGAIPTCIGNLEKLTYLRLARNSISGTIPTSIYLLSKLYNLYLQFNPLTGIIPTEIGLLSNIRNFYLFESKLSGTIPNSIGQMNKVQIFAVHKNKLVGTIPTSVGLMTQISLFLSYTNKLTGPIPTSVGYLTNMIYFNPSVNKLSGTIPTSLRLIVKLQELYLNDNKLTGSIPTTLNTFTTLYVFDFSHNSLTGTLPNWIWEISTLYYILLDGNHLNGTISSAIGLATSVGAMEIATNCLTGTIPTTIGLLSGLTDLGIGENRLIGTIPLEIINMTMLELLKIHTNQFTGSIPSVLFSMPSLKMCFLYSNQLTGTIPTTLTLNSKIQELNINNNYLSGTIPKDIGNCISLQRLGMSNNKLTGTLPTSLSTITGLQYLYFAANKLIGRLPSSMKSWSNLRVLEGNNNDFTGTIPTTLSLLSSLQEVYLRGNQFEGPITNLLNITYQPYIRNIDISDNYLTGIIPTTWFNSSKLEIFTATSNCLILPDLEPFCQACNLAVFSLDGLQTAKKCRKFFFPSSNSDTYTLAHKIKKNIPSCLYALSKLRVLHLSGNALTGTIPADVVLGDSLTDLTLSYNRMHGTIPDVIQQRSWSTLDLSFNSFSGTLSSSIPTITEADSKLSVNINRLSGNIPDSLLHRENVTVVEGNIFECNFDTNKLPSGDSDSSTYNCGSDAFYLALYVFFGTLFLTTIIVGLSMYLKVIPISFKSRLANKEVALTKLMFQMICLTFALTIFILTVMMPVFGALSRYYGTHSYEYAWSVSAGFLSGFNAKVIMLVVWSGMLLYFIVLYKMLFKSSSLNVTKRVILPEAITDTNIDANPRGLLWDNIILSILFLIDVVVVFAANAAYIIATLQGDIYTVVFVQILLGIFKVIWRYGYIEYIGYFRDYITGHTHRNKHELLFLTLMLVLNNVVLPVFSEAVIDSNCIYNMFVSPDPVVSTYNYNVCLSDSSPYELDICFTYGSETVDISFTPPFIYRYQCGATIITNYVSVYTYMFVFTALQIPMSAVLVWMRNHFTKGSLLYRILGLGVHQLHEDIPYLNYPLYVAGLISSLAILITFGAAFPPLAIIIFIAMFMDAIFVANALPVEEVPIPINDLGITLYLIPFSAIYFSFYLFDTSDYQEDSWSSLWAPMIMILIPLLCFLMHRLLVMLRKKYKSRSSIYKAKKQQADSSGSHNSSSDIPVTRQLGMTHSGEFLASPSYIVSIDSRIENDNEDNIIEVIDMESSRERDASSTNHWIAVTSEYIEDDDGSKVNEAISGIDSNSENTKSLML